MIFCYNSLQVCLEATKNTYAQLPVKITLIKDATSH